MTQKKLDSAPTWFEGEISPQSWRSLFKWGASDQYKHPNQRFYRHIQEELQLDQQDRQITSPLGLEEINLDLPQKINPEHLWNLSQIVGEQNIHTDSYTRLKASYGDGYIDHARLRERLVENLCDVVLWPDNEEQVIQIVEYANQQHLPIYPLGGGTSVTRGTEAVQGGISLDMSMHMKRVLGFNETDQTITVQPGILGPELESLLNHSPEKLGAKRCYTCGHFPQSFEYSSVGGWVATRGAGQNSTYYGKAEDLVLCQRMVTPQGVIETLDVPRAALGPDLNQVLTGSEGTFGILTAVTLKLFRYLPKNRRPFVFLFHSWQESLEATCEIMQCEAGFPSVLRLSDPEETQVAFKMFGIEGTLVDRLLARLGYLPWQRCLALGWTEGEGGHARQLASQIRTIARHYRGFNLTFSGAVRQWEKERYRDPYLRDDLSDYGIFTDTLECAVRWSSLLQVYQRVRNYIKSHPQTICMTHLSHAYPQGANLYFIFIRKQTSLKDYLAFQYGVLEEIRQSGAALSHHHGIGKQTAPWFAESMGAMRMGVLQALKGYFDPGGIMNPGGTLGLDMIEEQTSKRWGCS